MAGEQIQKPQSRDQVTRKMVGEYFDRALGKGPASPPEVDLNNVGKKGVSPNSPPAPEPVKDDSPEPDEAQPKLADGDSPETKSVPYSRVQELTSKNQSLQRDLEKIQSELSKLKANQSAEEEARLTAQVDQLFKSLADEDGADLRDVDPKILTQAITKIVESRTAPLADELKRLRSERTILADLDPNLNTKQQALVLDVMTSFPGLTMEEATLLAKGRHPSSFPDHPQNFNPALHYSNQPSKVGASEAKDKISEARKTLRESNDFFARRKAAMELLGAHLRVPE